MPAAACLLAEPKVCADIMFPSPPTPSKSGGGGGGRKRTVSFSEEEEDLSHLPSLQMRIQVLQQRVREEKDIHIDQIPIKTPNPKCRYYWCLIEFID